MYITNTYSILNNKYHTTELNKIKPFLKWAGGKGQLIYEIEKYYPFSTTKINKYAEPFIGGGAVLFDILNKYNLQDIYISDINKELINTYRVIQNNIDDLIVLLSEMENKYLNADNHLRKKIYLTARDNFNNIKLNINNLYNIEKAALMIFLNKTCFNGLYRVNKQGLFNVPMGAYKNPTICDIVNLYNISTKIQNLNIICGDYSKSADFIDEYTFVYVDPPYRPLTSTSKFTSYSENNFNDDEQIRLAKFIDKIHLKGAKIVISNSDPTNTNKQDDFFYKLYSSYNINKVNATRMINSNGKSRGKIKELLITNFIQDNLNDKKW